MAEKVLNRNFGLLSKFCCKPTRKCLENRHKSYAQNVGAHAKKDTGHTDNDQ